MTAILPFGKRWSSPLGGPSGSWESDDGVYRWLLWRTFAFGGDRPPLGFVMLNPSTANASVDDPTIRRCLGFAYRENAGGIIVVNLIPYRSPDPRDVQDARKAGIDVFGRGPLNSISNAFAIEAVSNMASKVVFGWGAKVWPWADNEARNARCVFSGWCLGKTKLGEPRHPLMVRSDQPLVRYP